MSFRLNTIDLLFDKMAEKEDLPLNASSFHVFSDKIMDAVGEHLGITISQKYLNEKYKIIEKSKKINKGSIVGSKAHFDAIAKYLGYIDLHDFEKKMFPPSSELSPILWACKGLWYSYLRCNSGRNDVLISPIEIYEADGKMWMIMRGPSNTYKGELLLKGSCLFCALDSGTNKMYYVTYKIGECLNAKALIGTFCGMTTAGDPIAGREVLERRTDYKKLEEMHNKTVSLKDTETLEQYVDWRIAKYFEKYEPNYIKITNVGTFSLNDLVME